MGAGDFYTDSIPGTAEGAITALTFVKIHTDTAEESRQFATAGAAAQPIGIAVDSAADEGQVAVKYMGVGRLLVDGSGSAIAEGDFLKPNASGYGVKATTSDVVGAIALEPSAAAGDIINVLLCVPHALTTPPSSFPRSYLDNEVMEHSISMDSFVTWDATKTALPAGAGTNDDLGWVVGVLGTSAPYLKSKDFKTTTCTQYALVYFVVPPEYVADAAATLRINAGALTTVSDGTMTVDAQVYDLTNDATTDICATATQSCNSLTPANKDFTLTDTNLAAGHVLAVRVSILGSDTATGTAVHGVINAVSLRLTSKG